MTDLANYQWLLDPSNERWLAEAAGSKLDELALANRLRKQLSADRTRLVVRQIVLRRQATKKFGELAEQMFFTDIHLQQATDCWIAAYKAERFRNRGPALDLCCGIGGDLVGLAGVDNVSGWDRSPIACLLAERNAAAALDDGAGDRSQVVRGSVEDVPLDRDQPWHIDPDRRATGTRRTDPTEFSPGIEVIESLLQASAFGAVKLAPGSRPPAEWETSSELEWISRGRECRQLVVWFEGLATAPGQRRATLVAPARENVTDLVEFKSTSFVGAGGLIAPSTDAIGKFVYDLDPALHAADLTGSFAAEHQLATIGPRGSYLTGDSQHATPLASCFEVDEVISLREKSLREALRARKIGPLEIKKRGVDVDPAALKKRLKLEGDQPGVLILTRVDRKQIAIVARRAAD